MAELGEIGRVSAAPIERQQIAAAFLLALLFHFFLGFWLQSRSDSLPALPLLSVIDVKLLPAFKTETETENDIAPQLPVQENAPPIAVEATPQIEVPAPSDAEPVPKTSPYSPVDITAPPILNNEAGSSAGQFPSSEPNDYVPSQWALEPPLKTERLEGMGLVGDMDCLRALSADCAGLRKEVFAEFELTEMEKVWTEKRADTGMPSQFYGMSEREIRLKIGSHIAGENGFMILPGIGIDGSLWDLMHGVKKPCQMKRGINSAGRYEVVRVCPDSQSAARDKKYYIPPKE